MADAKKNPTYWDENAVAERFNVSVRTVQRWRYDGDGPPYVRLGPNLVRYRPETIEAYAAAREYSCRAEELTAA